MGLLDSILANPEANNALAAGLLSGNFGAGLLGMNQVMSGQRQEAMKKQMLDAQMRQMALQDQTAQMQLAELKRKTQMDEAMRGAAQSSFRSPDMANAMSQGPGQAQVQPGFDQKAYIEKLYGIDPMEAIKQQQGLAKQSTINKLDVKDFTPESVQKYAASGNYADLVRMDKLHFADNGAGIVGLNPFSGQRMSAANKTGNPFSDLVVSDGRGGVAPNQPLINAKSQIAKSGASQNNISVNTEKSFMNEIAGGLGKSIVDSRAQAQGAVSTLGTLQRLDDALATNKVMAGPGSTFQQYGLQVGNVLGVGGKDAKEKLVNTRQAVQSLAQLELDAAQQMKGQGQITEAERSIIKRAAAGDIESMTVPELKVLSSVIGRSARSKISSYQQNIQPLKSNKNAEVLAPFLDVQAPSGGGAVDWGSLK